MDSHRFCAWKQFYRWFFLLFFHSFDIFRLYSITWWQVCPSLFSRCSGYRIPHFLRLRLNILDWVAGVGLSTQYRLNRSHVSYVHGLWVVPWQHCRLIHFDRFGFDSDENWYECVDFFFQFTSIFYVMLLWSMAGRCWCVAYWLGWSFGWVGYYGFSPVSWTKILFFSGSSSVPVICLLVDIVASGACDRKWQQPYSHLIQLIYLQLFTFWSECVCQLWWNSTLIVMNSDKNCSVLDSQLD